MNSSPFFKIEIFAPAEVWTKILETLAAVMQAGRQVRPLLHHHPVQGFWRPIGWVKPYWAARELFSGSEGKIEVLCREQYLLEAVLRYAMYIRMKSR